MPKPEKKYRTTNWPEYNAALKSRGSLSIRLDKEMAWYAAQTGKRGRSATYSDAAIQFCLSMKCLFGLPLRQSIGLVESLLELAGLDWRAPDFSTISRRQKSLQVTIPYRGRTDALHLLVDSTGVKMLARGNGRPRNMEPNIVVSGVRSILQLMLRHWKSGPNTRHRGHSINPSGKGETHIQFNLCNKATDASNWRKYVTCSRYHRQNQTWMTLGSSRPSSLVAAVRL